MYIVKILVIVIFFLTFYFDFWSLNPAVMQFIDQQYITQQSGRQTIESVLMHSIYLSYLFYRLGFLLLILIVMRHEWFPSKFSIIYAFIFISVAIYYNYSVIFPLLPMISSI
jgi:hypothetical protein